MKRLYENKEIRIIANVVLGMLVVTNLWTLNSYWKAAAEHRAHTDCEGVYTYINPRVRCGHVDVVDKKGYAGLRAKIDDVIVSEREAGRADMVGVWFRDLEAGPTLGLYDREDFIPASLLKLPLVITFLEMAQENPEILNKKITFTKPTDSSPLQTFKPEEPMKFGTEYSIDELLYRAIVFSDNNAAQLLYEYLLANDPDALSHTYRELGILEPGTDLSKKAVNVKAYGSIFRLLYNASYLNQDMSEKLLDMLVKSGFPYGLQQGIPANMKIAHKFGERTLVDGKKQLHDCGVIFYPGNAYQLCIMTEGKDYKDLQSIIGRISKMTYEEFDSRRILSPPTE